MSTFLQLVQDLARQSGTLAGGITMSSVSGVSGRAEKLVNWVKRAWEDIQNQRTDWLWLQDSFEDVLLVNTTRYMASSFNLDRHRKWAIDTPSWQPLTLYDPDIGQADEAPIRFVPYAAWRERYDRGTHDANRPTEYSISPAGELCVGPKPDKAYVIRGDYLKSPQTLALNTDTPECPAHLHQIIVWRALMMMAGGDESAVTLQFARPEYDRLFAILCDEQLPSVSLEGHALA